MVILTIIDHIKHLSGNTFSPPNLELDLKVPVKFCKQNHTKNGQGWLIRMGLPMELYLHRSKTTDSPDRVKTNSLQFAGALSATSSTSD